MEQGSGGCRRTRRDLKVRASPRAKSIEGYGGGQLQQTIVCTGADLVRRCDTADLELGGEN